MKIKILILLMVSLFTSCSIKTNDVKQSYITREVFIDELIKTLKIEINYFKEPKAHEYFKDVEDASPYAMSLITAMDAGILSPEIKKVEGNKPINYGDALKYINRAYMFKSENKLSKAEDFRREIEALDKKYEKMRSSDFIDERLKKNMMDIVKSKLGEINGNQSESGVPRDLKVYTSKSGNTLTITLDWGRKPTGGYVLKIVGAKEIDKNTIEVTYIAKEPGPNDIVTQVITYPKDSISISVTDIQNEYNIILKPKNN